VANPPAPAPERECARIDGSQRPRPSRLTRGPLYDYNLINPERLARERARVRHRFRVHAAVVLLLAAVALLLIPLRGQAHLGKHHAAAAYTPARQPQRGSVAAAATAPTGSVPTEIQYLRAPLVLDGVNQARTAGIPVQGGSAAARNVPAGTNSNTSQPATAPASPTPAATPTGTPHPTPAIGFVGDIPYRPNVPDDGDGGSAPEASATPTPTDTGQQSGQPAPAATPAPTPAPTPNDANREYATSDPNRPLYYDHVVQPGDTVSTIAARYGVATSTVLWNNPLITDRDALYVGQTVRVPTTDGVLYNVHLGDTLSDIADTYKVKPDDVIALAANGVPSADAIREGQTILLVGGEPPPPPPPPPPPSPTAAPTPQPQAQPPATAAPAPASGAPAAPPPTQAPAQGQRVSSSGWAWPATGPITSYFGPSHPLGIDIGQGPVGGQPIHAAKAGTVTFAGGDPCCSYGYYVDIDHGGGWSSRYGHCRSWPIVSVGQHVDQGQTICYAGSTGYSTGPHLHFEIHLNGQVLNPLNFLP